MTRANRMSGIRIVAVILVLMFLVGIIPSAVFAEGNDLITIRDGDPDWVRIEADECVDPQKPHVKERVPGKAASCTEPERIEHWICVFGTDGRDDSPNRIDKNLYATEDERDDTKIASVTKGTALGHDLVHVPAKAPTTQANGNIGYWQCSRCSRLFADDAGTRELQPGSIVVGSQPFVTAADPKLQTDKDGDLQLSVRAEYGNLTGDGKYTARLTLVDGDGKAVCDPLEKPISAAAGTTDLTATAEGLQGKTVRPLIEIANSDGKVVASNADALPDGIRIENTTDPSVGTSGVEAAKPDAQGMITISASALYAGLQPGERYTLVATLIDKDKNEAIVADQKPASVRQKFTPESSHGSIPVQITVPLDAVTGRSVGIRTQILDSHGNEVVSSADSATPSVSIPGTTEPSPSPGPSFSSSPSPIPSSSPSHSSSPSPSLSPSPSPGNVSIVVGDPDAGQTDPEDGLTSVSAEVEYTGLTAGREYTARMVLIDARSGAQIRGRDGKPFTGEQPFTPTAADGSVLCTLHRIDAAAIKGALVALAVDIVDGNGTVIASWPRQGVDQPPFSGTSVPQITPTVIVDKAESREQEDGYVTITATYTYEALTPGESYTVTGTLVDRQTGEPVLANGSAVTRTEVLNPQYSSDQGTLIFEKVDPRPFTGRDVGLLVEIRQGDRLIATNADNYGGLSGYGSPAIEISGNGPKDEPDDSKAAVELDGLQVISDKETGKTIVSGTLKYTGLTPGSEYTARATLLEAASGHPITVNGRKYQAEEQFQPEKPDGELRMMITDVDTAAIKGAAVTLGFELLDADGKVIAVWPGENPELPLTGLRAEQSTPTIIAEPADVTERPDKTVDIRAPYSYEALTPGSTYTVTGTLVDKKTGDPIRFRGKNIAATDTLVPKEPSGTGEMTFTQIDPSIFTGIDVGMLLEVRDADENLIASNADNYGSISGASNPAVSISGSGPLKPTSLTVIPHEPQGEPDKDDPQTTVITWDVEVYGLSKDYSYILSGLLIDRATGGLILVDGKPVAAEEPVAPGQDLVTLKFEVPTAVIKDKDWGVRTHLWQDGDLVYSSDSDLTTIPDLTISGIMTAPGTEGTETEVTVALRFNGLEPGMTYSVSGVLLDIRTGKPILIDGQEVTATTTFIALGSAGSVDLIFSFDAADIDLSILAVAATLERLGYTIASAGGADDPDALLMPQTATVIVSDVEISENAVTGRRMISVRIDYDGLTAGDDYRLDGLLVDRDSRLPIQEAEGESTSSQGISPIAAILSTLFESRAAATEDRSITARTDFTAPKSTGHEFLAFEFNRGTDISNADVEAKLTHTASGNLVASSSGQIHDSSNAAQPSGSPSPDAGSVTISNATVSAASISAASNATFTAAATVRGLKVGDAYTVRGELKNAANGQALGISSAMAASKTLSASAAEQDVSLPFTFDASDLAGSRIYVSWSVWDDAGNTLASLDASAATVTVEGQAQPSASSGGGTLQTAQPTKIPEADKGKLSAATGDTSNLWPFYVLLGGAALVMAFVIVRRIRMQQRQQDE